MGPPSNVEARRARNHSAMSQHTGRSLLMLIPDDTTPLAGRRELPKIKRYRLVRVRTNQRLAGDRPRRALGPTNPLIHEEM